MAKTRLAVIFYSMGGTNYHLAKWESEGAKEAGAEVRILKVPELAPQEVIDNNPIWKKTNEETKSIPIAGNDDLERADAIILSTPTRFGVMASQVKQFLDTKGNLWA